MFIGSIEIKNPVFLAPMAGDTDSAMRILCAEMGAELTVTEMVSAKAMHYGDKKTWSLAEIREGEGPVSVGSAPTPRELFEKSSTKNLSIPPSSFLWGCGGLSFPKESPPQVPHHKELLCNLERRA